MPTQFKGIDVSVHNGTVVWADVAKHCDFAIIRAGFGNNNIDKKAEANVTGCIKSGIPFGLYWFSYAYTPEMARKEAQHLLKFIGDRVPLMPLYYDFEYDSAEFARKKGAVPTAELIREMAAAFCEELEAHGYYAGIYCNSEYAKNVFNDGILTIYDVWYAQWAGDSPKLPCNLWQNSDKGSCAGVKGNVDTNIAFIDYPALIKSKGLNGYKPETPKEEEDKPAFVCPHGCPHCPHSKKD